MYKISALSASATLLLSVSPSSALAASKQDYTDHTLNATDVLNQQWYSQDTGLWADLWWNSGAMLPAIGDVALLSSDFKSTAEGIFSNSLTAAAATNPDGTKGTFLNNFYDDEGWWAMGWIKAYDVTGDSKYLDAAKAIFDDLLTGNNATCGGHWWSKDKKDNTAIGNELYLAVAASLANRFDDGTTYQNYAQAEVDFFLNAGLINENNTINDGLDVSTCQREGQVFSYNQGVILGALVEMNELTGNATYLDVACNVAHGAIDHMAAPFDGILSEAGYPASEDATGAQFKGVFARNLMYLQAARPEDAFVQFLQKNADSIWSKNRQDDGQMGSLWQGPIQNTGASAHSSALECLIAAATVTN